MTEPTLRERVLRLTDPLGIAAAAGFVGLFVALAARRLGFPYELEWMEGAMADHVDRVRDGLPLYVEPSVDFVPFIYPPGYYRAAAALGELTGTSGYVPMRALSLAATLGILALLVVVVNRRTGSWSAGAVAAGLYAGAWEIGGGWFDLGRVDALCVLLCVGAFPLMRVEAGPARRVAAGALIGLACLTKQTAAIAMAPLLLHLVLSAGAASLWTVGPLLLVGAGGTAALQAGSDGWFGFYVFELASGHGWSTEHLVSFWTDDLGRRYGLAAAVAFVWLVWGVGRRARATPDRVALVAFVGGMVLASWLSRGHPGGTANVLAFAHAGLALAAGVAWGRAGSPVPRLLVLGQLAMLSYSPAAMLPTDADRAWWEALATRVAAVEGAVLVPSHGQLATAAGKPMTAHNMAIADVLRGPDAEAAEALRESVRAAVREGRYGALVLDRSGTFQQVVRPGPDMPYRLEATLPPGPFPRAGWPTWPETVWVRVDPEPR